MQSNCPSPPSMVFAFVFFRVCALSATVLFSIYHAYACGKSAKADGRRSPSSSSPCYIALSILFAPPERERLYRWGSIVASWVYNGAAIAKRSCGSVGAGERASEHVRCFGTSNAAVVDRVGPTKT
eukprot:GHVU01023518.1.p1 GENE.GHVU01023518.1~~GHVU01023518.1.p1  ORF type:complete len:126 (+),score=4.53 GHVU01023518.1:686-1063(+)